MLRRLSPLLLVLGVALLFGLTAWGGIVLTSSPRIATIWFANGILVATLLTQSRNPSWWPALIGAGFIANLSVNTLLGDSAIVALGIATANTVEICTCAYGLRGHLASSADLLRQQVLVRFFAIAVLLAPTLASLIAAGALHAENASPMLDVMRVWIPADALGMALVVPLLLALQPRKLLAIEFAAWRRCLVPLALLLAVTFTVFIQSHYPLLFLLLPPVLLVAFRMGFNGAALAVSLVSAVAIVATLNGFGPFTPGGGISMAEQVFTMQLLLGTLMITTYPVCAMLVAQRRLAEAAQQHVTELSVSRAIVHALNERMTLAANVAKVGFWSWEPGNGKLEWDAQMYQMFQMDADSHSPSYDLARSRVHPMDIARLDQALLQVQHSGTELDIEFRLVWPDGSQRDIRCCALVQRDADGAPNHLIGLNIDVTQLRRLDRMKREFVSIVSHELRTPLTSIRGATGLLAHLSDLPLKAQHLIGIANRNAERLCVLVDDILDMEKIESGKMRFDLKQHEIGELVQQAISANVGYAARYEVRVRLLGEAPTTRVRVDATRFLQVMANLLSNAAKFSSPGSTVEVSVIEGISSLRIAVRDYGPGIAAEFQSKIFGRFNQGDASDSRTKSGSGLGLAICKALVERMDGTISFMTRHGLGTTFCIEFPIAREAPASAADSRIIALPVELN